MTIKGVWKIILKWFSKQKRQKEQEPPVSTYNSDNELSRIAATAVRITQKPEIQSLRATFDSGFIVEFACLHVRDIWGSEGSKGIAYIKSPTGVTVWFDANRKLRYGVLDDPNVKKVAYNPTISGIPELPECMAGKSWDVWITSDGKKMYMNDGIDLYALRALVGLAEKNLGVTGNIISVTGNVDKWQ